MSLGSNTGRFRRSVQHQIQQQFSQQAPRPKKPKQNGGGNIPVEVVVGFLAFIALIFLIKVW